MARVLAISDLHCPYQNPKAFEFLKRIRDKFKPDRIVCLGDEVDLHAFSTKYAPNPDLRSPSDELRLAIEGLKELAQIFPEMDVCESNHGIRIFKKAFVSGLPSAVVKRYSEIFEWPNPEKKGGWEYREHGVEIDGVQYIHGEGFSHSNWHTAHLRLRHSVVMGHVHSKAGVMMSHTKKHRHFTANAGCLIDQNSTAFAYGKHLIEKPIIGTVTVEDGELVQFHPLR